MSRQAKPADVDEIGAALPETDLGTSWGSTPTWKVPTTGGRHDDLLVILTPTGAEKAALVEDDTTPFVTIPHFDGHAAVLVQQPRLGEVSRDELAEIVTGARIKRAPQKSSRAYLADGERSCA